MFQSSWRLDPLSRYWFRLVIVLIFKPPKPISLSRDNTKCWKKCAQVVGTLEIVKVIYFDTVVNETLRTLQPLSGD